MKLRSRWTATAATIGMMTLSGIFVVGMAETVATTKDAQNNTGIELGTENESLEDKAPNKSAVDSVLVKATQPETQQATEAVTETSAQQEQTTTVSPYDGKFMVNVDEYLNIRAQADSNSEVVGKMYAGAGGDVIEFGPEWTKIKSGNVEGYVSNDYIVTGDAAQEKAKQVGKLQVTVNEDCLRVRKSPSTDSGVWGLAGIGDVYTGIAIENGWVSIDYDGETAYISLDYATAEFTIGKAISIEEEQEQLRIEQERALAEEEAEKKKEEEAEAALQQAQNESQFVDTVQTSAYSVSESDVYLLACLIHAEAGWEPYEGKLAVANIVLNRLNSGKYGNSLDSVIYAKGQFSVASSGRLSTVMAQGPNSESIQAAEEALSGVNNVPSYSGFCDLGSASYSRYNNYTVIGSQVFYN